MKCLYSQITFAATIIHTYTCTWTQTYIRPYIMWNRNKSRTNMTQQFITHLLIYVCWEECIALPTAFKIVPEPKAKMTKTRCKTIPQILLWKIKCNECALIFLFAFISAAMWFVPEDSVPTLDHSMRKKYFLLFFYRKWSWLY